MLALHRILVILSLPELSHDILLTLFLRAGTSINSKCYTFPAKCYTFPDLMLYFPALKKGHSNIFSQKENLVSLEKIEI